MYLLFIKEGVIHHNSKIFMYDLLRHLRADRKEDETIPFQLNEMAYPILYMSDLYLYSKVFFA